MKRDTYETINDCRQTTDPPRRPHRPRWTPWSHRWQWWTVHHHHGDTECGGGVDFGRVMSPPLFFVTDNRFGARRAGRARRRSGTDRATAQPVFRGKVSGSGAMTARIETASRSLNALTSGGRWSRTPRITPASTVCGVDGGLDQDCITGSPRRRTSTNAEAPARRTPARRGR